MIEKIVRETECKALTGLSRVTRWRMEQVGNFPKRRQISPGTVGWLLSDIQQWLKSRVQLGGGHAYPSIIKTQLQHRESSDGKGRKAP
jgi:prophage regulatory protein